MSNFTEANNVLVNKAELEIKKRVNDNLASIKKGDKVQLIYCIDALRHEGKVFKVLADPTWQGYCWCVELDQLGLFHLGFVKKI